MTERPFSAPSPFPTGPEFASHPRRIQRRGLRMLLDARPLRDGILEGIRGGAWVYYDPREGAGYGAPSPTPYIDLAGEGELLEPAEARARGIPIKGEAPRAEEERCPVCHQPAPACTCGRVAEPPPPAHFRAEGAVDQALQALVDQMHDQRVATLRRLVVRVQREPRGSRSSGASGSPCPSSAPAATGSTSA